MASQVVVTGRVLHAKMTPGEVFDRLKVQFPQAQLEGDDFSINLTDCKVSCYRSNLTTLDFRIDIELTGSSSKTGPQRVVAATELLIRSTDTLWSGLSSGLSKRFLRRSPVMDLCVIEDVDSKNALLVRDKKSPLRSAAAKLSYTVSSLLLLAMSILIYWQLGLSQSSASRLANVLTITLSLAVAAVVTPTPVLAQWLEWRKNLVWRYVRSSA
jgi:hypothetical protein